MSRKAIDAVGSYIRSIRHSSETGETSRELYFSDEDLGGLWLSDNEVDEYRQILDMLVSALPKPQLVSERTVEKWFQHAILDAIRPEAGHGLVEERLLKALGVLSDKLKTSPVQYDVFYPVNGIAHEELPQQVGKVKFLLLDEEQRTYFERIANNSELPPKYREGQSHIVRKLWERGDTDGVFACTQVSAVDDDSAREVGLHQIRLTVDTVNFFADLVPYERGRLFLPPEAGRALVTSPVIRHDTQQSIGVQYSTVGALSLFSMRKFQNSIAGTAEFIKVTSLLTEQHSKLDTYKLAALQWAGRATVAFRREEAFLLYVIALESLLLSDSDNQELSYRLRLRLAHLLGETYTKRNELFEEMGRLYKIRSNLVHSGKFEVTDVDLSKMRAYAKTAILRILLDEPFVGMQSTSDLAAWFKGQTLGSGHQPVSNSIDAR